MPKYSVAYWRGDQLLMTVTKEAADIEAAPLCAQRRLQQLPHAACELRLTIKECAAPAPTPTDGK